MTKTAALISLHKGQSLAVSVPSGAEDFLAWVGVYPLDLERHTTRELLLNHGQPIPLRNVRVYRIRRFEVDRLLVEQEASISEVDLKNKVNCFAFGDDDLVERLKQLGVRLEQLLQPSKSNYPI